MNAGEYVGKDGRTYRWVKDAPDGNDGYSHRWVWNAGQADHTLPMRSIKPEDVSAAKAALDALIEQDAGEWVEAGVPYKQWPHEARVRLRDGAAVEYQLACGPEGKEHWVTQIGWSVERVLPMATEAYRAGQKVRDEAVRELVEALDALPLMEWSHLLADGTAVRCYHSVDVKPILAAAAKVKL